jgi:hypothetical protein
VKFKKKVINVLGHDYKIEIVPQSKLLGGRSGECEWPTRIIRLSKELKGEMLFIAFWHEVWHASQFESGDMQILHDQVQEKHADRFASMMSSFKKQGFM